MLLFEHRTGHSVDWLERSLQAASSTREKWPRRRHDVDGHGRPVATVGGVDRQGGDSDGRVTEERNLILKFSERERERYLILAVEKNEETFGISYQVKKFWGK